MKDAPSERKKSRDLSLKEEIMHRDSETSFSES